jgi:hypothetical protein
MTTPYSPDIPQVLRNARLFKPGRHDMLDDEMAQTVSALFALLDERHVDYVLVGGIALLHYVAARNTEDIDLILAVPDLARLPELRIETQDANFARADFRGLRVDLLLSRNRFFEHIRSHHVVTAQFRQRPIPIVTPAGLILLKCYALPSLYRQGEFERVALYETDLTLLLHRYPASSDSVLASLRPYLAEHDVSALAGILREIEARIERYSGKQP